MPKKPASGGTPPYTWSVVSGALPPGMLVRNEGAPSYITMPAGSKGWLGGTINSWSASNPITYTFTLREGVLWQRPALARDGAYAWLDRDALERRLVLV